MGGGLLDGGAKLGGEDVLKTAESQKNRSTKPRKDQPMNYLVHEWWGRGGNIKNIYIYTKYLNVDGASIPAT